MGRTEPESEQEKVARLRRGLCSWEQAGIYGKVTYSFVTPLLRLGAAGGVDDDVGPELLPKNMTTEVLAEKFDATYDKMAQKPGLSPEAIMWWTYFFTYRSKILLKAFWTLADIAVRLVAWFWGQEQAGGSGGDFPAWQGWVWSVVLAILGFLHTIIHHQLFWVGMISGFAMRMQAMAAVQRKVLRLNGASVSAVTTGKIINLVSNDVRRFDEFGTMAIFAIAGPLELIIVYILIGLRMGYPASTAGIAATLLIIPFQAVMGKRIAKLRHLAAQQTDERVRLTSEALSGILAAKMLCWEDTLLSRIHEVRQQEDTYVRRQNRIRAVNMGLAFGISPLAALITFATARGTGVELTVANVFYTIALLQLPRLFVADFFVRAVEAISELRVSMRRLAQFLSLREPPPPPNEGATGPPGTVDVPGLDFDWDTLPWLDDGGAAVKADRVATGKDVSGDESTAGAGLQTATDAKAPETHPSPADPSATTPKLPTLQHIVLHSSPGRLIGVVGEVGSGKSSLLAVLLGELQPLQREQKASVAGSMAYVSQVPWVVAGTVKDNILFGAEEDPELYKSVVTACALTDDLKLLTAGDQTELGERGINLSGGQKARLTLARAAYSRASVQLLDDPLSAVDPRVGRTLFDKCIGPSGIMQGSTRILVTHQTQHLAACDEVVVMRRGTIVERGTMAELQARGVPEAAAVAAADTAALDDTTYGDENGGGDGAEVIELVSAEETATESREDGGAGDCQDAAATGGDAAAVTKATTADPSDSNPNDDDTATVETSKDTMDSKTAAGDAKRVQTSVARTGSSKAMLARGATWIRRVTRGVTRRALFRADDQSMIGLTEPAKMHDGKATGKLVEAESRSQGSVGLKVYGEWAGYMGWPVVITLAAALLVGQAVYLYGDYWIAMWSSKSPEEQQEAHWIWGYAIMVGCVLAISLARAQLFFTYMLTATSAIHHAMAERVARAPLSFFHTNPTGRILNRFSKDLGGVDELLPVVAFDAIQCFMLVMGAFVLLMVVVPFIIPVFVPVVVAFVCLYRYYVRTSREVKRFEATTRSPVYASFSATLKGLATIRAYRAGPRFRRAFLQDLTANGSWWFTFVTCARWVGFRLDALVACVMTVAPLLMMAIHNRLSARLVGLGLSQSLQLAGVLQWMMRQAAEVENHMTSVERMLEYTRLDQEPATLALGGAEPPKGWPETGAVEYDDVTAVYRAGLAPVLRGISFTLEGGVSCGVVGRTGSGKSSLLLTLFRLIPVTRGTIRLGGVDASSIALDALRRQLAIIPQDPVLFSGTLRLNLDPTGVFDDHRLWDVLQAVQLETAVQSLGGLGGHLQEAGDNLSVGQRQLFCLARALLQGASVLALDEATANVDRATDALIQDAVRRFSRGAAGVSSRPRTVIVIAHRINTIMDCDRLLVLSDGRLVETGNPQQLARGNGVFGRLVAAAAASTRPARR